MDPQNSGLDCIPYHDLDCHDRVFNLHRRSLLQHVVVCRDLFPMLLLGFCRDRVSLVMTIFFSLAYSFCCDRVSSIETNLFVAPLKSVLQSLLF